MTAKQLQFGRYLLDLDRGCLLSGEAEIALRPKTFGVLRYLTENSGRLVSKDELFAAVWPNVAVTDDALVQSIGELRRALGDDGSRLIRTVPRRGYRFEAAVSPTASTPSPASVEHPLTQAPPTTPSSRGAHGTTHVAIPYLARLPVRVRIALLAVFLLGVALSVGAMLSSHGRQILLAFAAPDTAALSSPKSDRRVKAAIAVLPFRNETGDSSRAYFADGLSQDIINALGRFPDLTVLSWNAVFAYEGKSATPEQIARDLGVDYEVEASVLQTGQRVRVIAQLVNAEGRVLWSDRFDEAIADLFSLQDKITTHIAGALAIRVGQMEEQRVLAKSPQSLEAYDYVLRARPALHRPTRANNAESRALLRRALEIDPGSAAAYAGLAETYYAAVAMGWAESPTDSLSRAEEMANKALTIDSRYVGARVTLGRIHIVHRRYEEANAELQRALAINRSDAQALAGQGNVLMWMGQTDAAIDDLEQARRIDPELNPIDRFALSLAYYVKGRYDDAIQEAELNLRETNGANFSRVVLAAAYAQRNRAEDAARITSTILRDDPTFDAQTFGSKFLSAPDLAQLREGLRKAGLLTEPQATLPAR